MINYMKDFKLKSTKGLTKKYKNGYSILNGVKYFNEDGSQNYFIFQPLFKIFSSVWNNYKYKGYVLEA